MKIAKEVLAAETLAEFDFSNFDEDHRMDEGEWRQMLEVGFVATYVARNEEGEIAAIIVLKRPSIEVGVWYFYSVAVAEKYRKMKLATRIFYEAIKAEIPFGIINSHCHIDNQASISLHKSLGFIPIQYVTDFYGEFGDAILWKRAR
jgi:RimJ/RimL family protein N-acetyltransferase